MAVATIEKADSQVHQGVLRELGGRVRSRAEQRAAIDAAKFTPGVRAVDESEPRVDPHVVY